MLSDTLINNAFIEQANMSSLSTTILTLKSQEKVTDTV